MSLQIKTEHVVKKRMLYDADDLILALKAVFEEGYSMRAAAKLYNVPFTTLNDRVNGRVAVDCTGPGPAPLLSKTEETELVEHIMAMSSIGHAYTRTDTVNIAGEYLCSMDRREPSKPLSFKWLSTFMKRWPELSLVKLPTSVIAKAKDTSPEMIERYYSELQTLFDKYDLKDKPQCIYSVYDKRIKGEDSPPKTRDAKNLNLELSSSPLEFTTNVMACGNADGISIPPYFIFQGEKFNPKVLNNSCHGSSGAVSLSGQFNSQVFKSYLEHFVSFSESEGTKLLLFDGPKPYVNPDTITYAKTLSVVLFVLPPHTSLIFQSLGVGQCFRLFSGQYLDEEKQYTARHTGQVMSRSTVAELAGRAYSVGLSPSNLKMFFNKCGIFPFNPMLVPATEAK